MCAFNLACLPCFFEFLRSFWRILRLRTDARSYTIPACSKGCDRKCINAVEFYRILQFLNLKFSSQNLIVPKF